MPTANTIDSTRIVGLRNSAPMNTISADIPTNSAKVFAPLAYPCRACSPRLQLSVVEQSTNHGRLAGFRPVSPPVRW